MTAGQFFLTPKPDSYLGLPLRGPCVITPHSICLIFLDYIVIYASIKTSTKYSMICRYMMEHLVENTYRRSSCFLRIWKLNVTVRSQISSLSKVHLAVYIHWQARTQGWVWSKGPVICPSGIQGIREETKRRNGNSRSQPGENPTEVRDEEKRKNGSDLCWRQVIRG